MARFPQIAFVGTLALVPAAAPALAAPTVNGILDAEFYGPALATQNTQTGYGNNTDPSAETANGSELNQAFARVEGDALYLMLTGNVQTNWSQLELFIDAHAGGQNTILAGNANVDGGALQKMAGLKFDAAVSADYYVRFVATGNVPRQMWGDYVTMPTGAVGSTSQWFQGGAISSTQLLVSPPTGIEIALNNSNVSGVEAGDGLSGSAADATTGAEYKIPLAAIGNPTGDIRLVAFINDGGHQNVSNQVLGGLGGGGNLGNPANVDFSAIAGDQYFTVAVPEPATLGLLALGGLLARRRR